MRSSSRDGFTILEISIVIGVIALIAGAVVAGQSMVNNARLNSIGVDLTRYDAAIQTFRGRYKAWPGDMVNATSYWGAADADTATCYTTTGSGTQTCNGNGDGQVGRVVANGNEAFRLWQHLFNDGLILTRYSGVQGSGSAIHHVIGSNCPASKVKGAGFGVFYYSLGTANFYSETGGNQLVFGSQSSTSLPMGAIIRAADAYSIDLKLDDGKPAFGIVTTYNATTRPNCASSDTASAAVYVVGSTSEACQLFFKLSNQTF